MGIQELYRPASGDVEVDIVAVHGLQGDVLKTWSSKSDKKVCWLRDRNFLPKFLPQARVISWGYNANVLALKGKTTSQDRILQHAQTLIAQLVADRDLEGASGRPIIFLCHSLGGIIVKRVVFAGSRVLGQSHSIKDLIPALHLYLHVWHHVFGTPHHGSSKASMLSTVRKLASVTMPSLSLEEGLLSALEEGSETLQDISDQFCPLMCRFRIFFFWEQEKSNLVPLHKKDYVVPESSAAPIIDNTERCGIAADHSAMCKFVTPSDQGFRDVMAALKRYTRDAPALISVRREREREVLLQQRRDEAMENLGLYKNPGDLHIFTTDGQQQSRAFISAPRRLQAGGMSDEPGTHLSHRSEEFVNCLEDEHQVLPERTSVRNGLCTEV